MIKKSHVFRISSKVLIDFKSTQLCEIAYNAYLPEFNIKKSKRSKIMLQRNEHILIFRVKSDDITAFRAALNEIISFGKIFEKSLLLF
jgi:tRNA threonylcarbamoyladenosine modification (KEOPS) complex  Pcc1 subunit